MISSIVSRLVIIVFGTLYPAYASYKAVRTKNVKEYVKWMMYWIVFALFTCAETFTDIFFSFWFPFYYEIKVLLVLWLLSPATKGSSILYRKFVHPMLSRHEQEIDEYIAKAKEQGYHTVLHLGTKGVNYATTVIMQTAIKGGGGLVQQLRRSYSLSDLSSDMGRNCKALPECEDHADSGASTDPRLLRPRGHSPRRSASGSGRVEMYFPEVDVDVRSSRETNVPLSHIRSTDDVSSGYSSAEPLYVGHHHATKSEGLASSREPLVRTASVGSTRTTRAKSSRGGATVTKRTNPTSTNEGTEDSYTQEDCFELPYDFPTCPPSRHHSLPLSEQEVAQSLGINPELLSLLRSWSNNNLLDTCDEPTILADLDPATEHLKEDLCHYDEEDTFFDSVSGSDGKSDTSNKPEAVADVKTKSPDIENNLINSAEFIQKSDCNKLADESCTFSDAFGESLVETEVCAHETHTLVKACENFQTETVALEKCPTSNEPPVIVGISNEHMQIEVTKVENTKGIEFEASSESAPCQDDREEILPVAEDKCSDSNEPPVIVGIPNEQLQIEIKNVHSKDVRLEASSEYVQYQDSEVISKQSNVKGNVEHENMEEKPSQMKPGEQLYIQGVSSQQNSFPNSKQPEMDPENVVNDLEINLPDICVEQPAAQSADVKSSDSPTVILNEELKFEDCLEIVEVPLEIESCEAKLKENGMIKRTELAPEGSVTTQSFSVTDADSVSESGSTRKDERSGRYNKLQAPSPPPRRVKEIKGRNGEENSHTKDARTSDIKDGPNSGETSQKPTKRRKRNSGNTKMGEKHLTRLQSQIENLASLLPFWHSRHDSLASVQSCVGSTSHLDSLSVSSADNVPGRKLSSVSVSSNSEQEKLAKTPDIGEYHIREMSHSPVFGKRL